MDKRSSGILLHISSLPSKYGIGAFGKEAYDFVDFLYKAGQSYWQILPLGITGFGDSPYQSVSAFAGNYFFIDLDKLVEEGFLINEDLVGLDFKDNDDFVNYDKVYDTRLLLLRKAYRNGYKICKNDVMKFVEEEKNWLEDFALYMALKTKFDRKTWQEWDIEYRDRYLDAIKLFRTQHSKEIEFWYFVQYLFFKQWNELKSYSNNIGIKIIGDLPIYVAEDSADVWTRPELFMLDSVKKPIMVSGCPPDDFAITGQLWGNPIYNWNIMKINGYKWWIERMDAASKIFDVTRIDHFRGFESYWEIPSSELTAENGKWVDGPGIELFDAIKSELGELDIIAEDLGFLTEEFYKFKDKTGFPGMNILQFAFDSREENNYLPHNYEKNSICYTGTHDNNTMIGWMNDEADLEEIEYAKEYLKLSEEEGYHIGFIRACLSSVSNLAIIPIQDYLGLGSDARFNIPSTIGGNWIWRVRKEKVNEELASVIYKLTKTYWRLNENA